MGSCFSKKNEAVLSPLNSKPQAPPQPPPAAAPLNPNPLTNNNDSNHIVAPQISSKGDKKPQEEEGFVKKEIFVIKHRKSHDRNNINLPSDDALTSPSASTTTNGSAAAAAPPNMVVRTSSCTKEEVDAILIQCGRLSRSNSSGAAKPVSSSGTKYSGSKRSYDFDQDQDVEPPSSARHDSRKKCNDDDGYDDDRGSDEIKRRHRQRQRQPAGRPSPSSPSQSGRRRTPSRERDQNQRSGSRERGSGISSRRVSRSPGRRSETTSNTAGNATNVTGASNRPGKMVSVPATVSSLAMDKSNIGVEPQATTGAGIKRISVKRRHRQRQRQPAGRPSPSSPSQSGRRRTPSRERDQNQRSGSRERGSGISSRRVSRSPGRRSETTSNTAGNATNVTGASNRPGKMVSVPATVSSLAMDKSNIGVEPQATTGAGIKRISVKRNVGEAGGSRTAASPRSQSPARTNAKTSNETTNQQPSLSRNNSRKADQSPHRRNPLSEIDPNSLPYPQPSGNNRSQVKNKDLEGQAVVKESFNPLHQTPMKKQHSDKNNRVNAQVTNCRGSSVASLENKISKEQQMEDAKRQPPVTTTVVDLGVESLKPQSLTRSRSARRSRDLDLNPETLLDPTPSYTTLLLEDIQNFHQKNTPPSFSLPACVTKACSILEAVADLNSTTSSNLSCAISDDRRSPLTGVAVNLVGKKIPHAKDPFVESEIYASDDLMEPSFHKYVTVRRGGSTSCTEDMDGQESSGSNSFVGGSQQHLGCSSSAWEPNSADSTDRWTSKSNTREEDEKSSPLGLSETGHDVEQARRAFSGQRTGIGRGRLGTSTNFLTTAAST